MTNNQTNSTLINSRASSTEAEYKAFDSLPKILRDYLRSYPYRLSASDLTDRLNKGATPKELMHIADRQLQSIGLLMAKECYGQSYPVAPKKEKP